LLILKKHKVDTIVIDDETVLNLLLLSLGNIAADGLRRALHRFGGHLQAGQHLHLLTPMIEGRFLTDHGMHAAHTGGGFGIHDIQFHIDRKLALMTSPTPQPLPEFEPA
jgi:hypothetical protein